MSDLYLLQESVLSYLQQNRLVYSAATGDAITLQITEQFRPIGAPAKNDLIGARMAFQLENVYTWLRPALLADVDTGIGFGVKSANLDFEVGHTKQTLQITED